MGSFNKELMGYNRAARDVQADANTTGEPHMVVSGRGFRVIRSDDWKRGDIHFVAYPLRWVYRPNRYRLTGVER